MEGQKVPGTSDREMGELHLEYVKFSVHCNDSDDNDADNCDGGDGGGGGGGDGDKRKVISLMQSLHIMIPPPPPKTVMFLFLTGVTSNAVMHCSRSTRNVSE
jgi:hypothetical protein